MKFRSSPLNSPLDGFKRSVADSTISDDMLPQPVPEDYSESPPSFKKHGTKESLSPQPSPKRIPLDDRINQVLGLEKPEPVKPPTLNSYSHQNYQFSSQTYSQPPLPPQQQYGQYNQQYGQQFNEQKNFIPSFPPGMFTQPPPPIVKTVATPPTRPTAVSSTPTKVVQVGNILQVVPNEEIMPAMIESKVIGHSSENLKT